MKLYLFSLLWQSIFWGGILAPSSPLPQILGGPSPLGFSPLPGMHPLMNVEFNSSTPPTLLSCSLVVVLRILFSSICTSSIMRDLPPMAVVLAVGILVKSSVVNTEVKYLFSRSALSTLSTTSTPFAFFRGPMECLTLLFCRTYAYRTILDPSWFLERFFVSRSFLAALIFFVTRFLCSVNSLLFLYVWFACSFFQSFLFLYLSFVFIFFIQLLCLDADQL